MCWLLARVAVLRVAGPSGHFELPSQRLQQPRERLPEPGGYKSGQRENAGKSRGRVVQGRLAAAVASSPRVKRDEVKWVECKVGWGLWGFWEVLCVLKVLNRVAG